MAPEEEGTKTNQLIGRLQELSRPRQIVLAVIAVAVLVSLLLVIQHFNRPRYVTLYHDLDPAQAAPLLQHLQEQGVPYQLDDLGTTLKVPQERADELRIEMAGQGMPFAQGLGLELFDEERLGMTDYERRVKMQRALQEELRRTITSLDAVLQARVHLVLPEPHVFLKERGESSAAIYLKLNPFVALEQNQIQGIVYLVASSVEGLQPENVTLIDSQGNILRDALTPADAHQMLAETAARQLEVKRHFEMELERRVQNMVERVSGPGKALALVTAELDFDASETTVITYDESGVPRSTHVLEESSEGGGAAAAEVGEANYPGYVGVLPGGEGSSERREETTNYEIGESTLKTIAAPGKVLRLHTSVVLDTGDGPISERRIADVNDLVTAAIGFDEERGDRISVQGMSFDRSHEEEMEAAFAALDEQEREERLHRLLAIGGGALLLVFLLILLIRRAQRRYLTERALVPPPAEDVSLEDLIAEREEEVPPGIPPEKTLQGQVRAAVETNMDVAVAVLRSWLTEK